MPAGVLFSVVGTRGNTSKMSQPPANSLEVNFLRLTTRILEKARTRIDTFQLDLLQILREELDLIACSLYSLNPFSNTLSLRGQVGLSYREHKSFSLGIDS